MKITNRQLVEQALVRIEQLHEHITAVDSARYIAERHSDGKALGIDLRHALIERELDEWRNVFLWALTLEPAEQERIKAAAHERFLSDNQSVAHWFNDGDTPSMWLDADEKQFRAMARKAFGPVGEK